MRKLIVGVAAAWVVLGLGAIASGGPAPAGPLEISVSSGTPGTTVTVTGHDCGNPGGGLRSSSPRAADNWS
jgi:hypothetical protein